MKKNINHAKKIFLVLFISVLFTFLFKTSVFASCEQAITRPDNSLGCADSSMAHCSNDVRFCCDSSTECTTKDFSTECDPGSGGITLGSCLKLSNDSKVQDVYTTPSFLVNLIVDNLFVAAGIVIFVMVLLAGFFFITGGKKGLEQARQILLAVLVGFGIMFAAYWIVQIIKTVTGADILI